MTARFLAKSALALFALTAVVMSGIVAATPAQARVIIGFGVGPFFGAPYPYPYPYYGYPYPYYSPPVVYAPGYGPGYRQDDPDEAPAPANAAPTWYYCTSPAGYYPYVKQCSVAWRPVAATPPRQ